MSDPLDGAPAPKFAKPHWTDYTKDRPIFKTVINARGPAGNIYSITGSAYAHMRHLQLPTDRIDSLKAAVEAAQSYDEAIAAVEVWFKVDRDAD